jgi:hypothetical protein
MWFMNQRRHDEDHVVRHHVDVHIHGAGGDISEFKVLLQQLIQRTTAMSQELDTLTQEIARNTAVDESAIALIQGLASRIEELKNEPAALQALADELRAKNDALADAVTANTPASP